MHPEISFDELWPAATAWAEEQERNAIAYGRPLSEKEIALAKRVKVSRPDLVKVWIVPSVPVPTEGLIARYFQVKGLNVGDRDGFTVGHSVFLRQGAEDTSIFAHELRHSAQFEALGSVKNFTFCYLKELDFFGYLDMPLERDAILAEKEFETL